MASVCEVASIKRDFGMANGRDAASADTVADMPPDLQQRW
jgi:hypothetical protein